MGLLSPSSSRPCSEVTHSTKSQETQPRPRGERQARHSHGQPLGGAVRMDLPLVTQQPGPIQRAMSRGKRARPGHRPPSGLLGVRGGASPGQGLLKPPGQKMPGHSREREMNRSKGLRVLAGPGSAPPPARCRCWHCPQPEPGGPGSGEQQSACPCVPHLAVGQRRPHLCSTGAFLQPLDVQEVGPQGRTGTPPAPFSNGCCATCPLSASGAAGHRPHTPAPPLCSVYPPSWVC